MKSKRKPKLFKLAQRLECERVAKPVKGFHGARKVAAKLSNQKSVRRSYRAAILSDNHTQLAKYLQALSDKLGDNRLIEPSELQAFKSECIKLVHNATSHVREHNGEVLAERAAAAAAAKAEAEQSS